MSIHEGHRDRVREKIENLGLSSLHPHEMLEFLLFHSIPRKDTNPIAHELIKNFGSISAVFDASIEDLMKVKGVSKNSALLIKSIPEFLRIYFVGKVEQGPLDCSERAGDYILPRFLGRTEEALIIAFLNHKLVPINCEVVLTGSIDKVPLDVRKIIELCVKYNATSILMAHNHPGGIAIPSTADINATKKLEASLDLIRVKLVDHLIIADDDFVSMKDSKYF